MKIALDADSTDRRTRIACLNGLLEGLVIGNMHLMTRSNTPFPPLFMAGVRYEREPRTGPWYLRERWLYCTQVKKAGKGDCEDLAAWRAAELRLVNGEPARAILIPSGEHTLHAIVIRGDGTIDDPSKVLGMGAGTIAPDDPHAGTPEPGPGRAATGPLASEDPLDEQQVDGQWPWNTGGRES